MPDAATLERLVGALKASDAESVIDTVESPGRVAIEVRPESIVGSLEVLRAAGYSDDEVEALAASGVTSVPD